MEPNLEGRLKGIEIKLDRIEKIVTKIRKVQKRSATVRALYWVFIILLGLGAFYFIQPYINQVKDMYGFIGGDGQYIDEFVRQFQGQDQ